MAIPTIEPAEATVLLVDDDPASLEMLRAVLAQDGLSFTMAQSGAEALRLVEGQDFAAIVLDVHMPGMDGFETATRFKKLPQARETPIIFLTGSADMSQVFRGYESGAVDYMVKPFDTDILRSKIGVFVELWRKSEQAKRQAEVIRRLEVAEVRRASEERYRTLANAMPQMAWTSDGAGRAQFFNQRWYEYTGLSQPESLEGWSAAVHPDDRAAVEMRWQEAIRRGRVFEAELRLLRERDGVFRWHLARALPIEAEGEQVVGWVGTLTDIEDQKRATAEVAAQYGVSQALTASKTLVEATPGVLKAIGQSLSWAIVAMWRTSPEDETKLCCTDVWAAASVSDELTQDICGEPVARVGTLIGSVYESGEPRWVPDLRDEPLFRRGLPDDSDLRRGWMAFPVFIDGQVSMLIECFSRDIREPDEELVGMMRGIAQQIGQFVERRDLEEALRSSEQLKGAVIGSSLDCVITMDHRGRVTEFNPAAEQAFGYRREEAIGQEMASLIIPERLRAQHRAGLKHYLETGEQKILGQRLELPALRADGSEFTAELTITRVDLPGPPLFTGFLRDISERKQAEAERLRLFEAEAEARRQAERRQRQLAVLAQAGEILTRSLDYERTMANVAQAVVPQFADWCAVYFLEDNDSIRLLTAAHADQDKADWVAEYALQPPGSPTEQGIAQVIKSGRPELVAEVDEEKIAEWAGGDEERLAMLNRLGLCSYLAVPLVAHGRPIGALAFFSSEESGRHYTDDDVSLAAELARRAATAIENARLYHERNEVARTLERSLLPPSLPRIPSVEVAARYHPAAAGSSIGGDFYDLFEVSEGVWMAVVGDVVGKGAEAAALTSLARHTIRTASRYEDDPVKVLEVLNQAILRGGAEGQFCTVVCVKLTPRGDHLEVTIADAGHPLPYVIHEGRVDKVEVRGVPLGMWPDADVGVRDMLLAPGEKLIFYTDGVVEARNKGELYGDDRLRAFLEAGKEMEAPELAARLELDVVLFQEEGVRDDIAILIVEAGKEGEVASHSSLASERRGSSAPRIDLRLECTPRSVAVARHAVDTLALHLAEDDLATAQLLTSEVVSNAVKYSFSEDAQAWVGFSAELSGHVLKVEVTDSGLGFAPAEALDARASVNPAAEHGRGLFLVEALASDWGVRYGERNCVWFEVALSPASVPDDEPA